MRVLVVNSDRRACGIAEHTAMLMEAVEATGFRQPDTVFSATPEALDPYRLLYDTDWVKYPWDVVHLNYHMALHSRWGVEQIAKVQALGAKVLLTLHDSGVPNSDQAKALCRQADYFIVHEPYDDLPAHGEYLRMGVPDWQRAYTHASDRPKLGAVGFPFPWKGFNELALVTAQCGWDFFLIAPTATEEQVLRWRDLNPRTVVRTGFAPREFVVSWLAGCDATAATYSCANTGQSGAILQCLAARKPVIAFSHCRQMRALNLDPLGHEAICWCEDYEGVADALRFRVPIGRFDPGIVALAEQDSWAHVGRRYAEIYKELAQHDAS